MGRAVTIKGVASVSRVLNGTDRLLQRSTTRTIGGVLPSPANPVFADVVLNAQKAFMRRKINAACLHA